MNKEKKDKTENKEKKETVEKVKQMLKKWGGGNIFVKEKNNEYKNIQSLYESGKKSKLVTDAELFGYRSLAEQVFRDVREYMYEKEKTEKMLEALDTVERSIIVCRYVKNIKWDSLPAYLPMGISTRQCYRIHNEALEKLADMYNEDL